MLTQEPRINTEPLFQEIEDILNGTGGNDTHDNDGECAICGLAAHHHCIQCKQAICTGHRRLHIVPNGFLGVCPGCYIRMTANTQHL